MHRLWPSSVLGLLGVAVVPLVHAQTPPPRQEASASFEGLLSDDIRLTSSGLQYARERGSTRFDTGIVLQTFDLEYRPAPFDFLGVERDRDEYRVGAQAGVRTELIPRLSGQVSAGAYTGYGDYRSIWLDEYFRQQFEVLPGYSVAAPRGEQASVGLRWEYLPSTGYLHAEAGWRHDVITPGYEIDFEGLRRGRSHLHTASWRIAAEHALGTRVRTLQELRIIETSGRDVRLAWQGTIHMAIGDHWMARVTGGFTRENPTFEAHHFGGSLEYATAGGWTWGATGRFYRDTGEIENTLFSNAAPGVDAWQAGIFVRRQWGSQTARIGVSPYATRYEPFGIGTAFFQHLYRDRDWILVQAAYALEF